jgi:protein-tyrosine-phosphatase
MFFVLLSLLLLASQTAPGSTDAGPFVRSLWLLQHYETAEAANPANDHHVKAVLAKAVAKDGAITLPALGGLMNPDVFKKIAGANGSLDPSAVSRALAAATPESRNKLWPKAREHADYLTTTFDMIDGPHREAGQKLAEWVIANYKPGKPLHITVVCTGNSRRSIMGASMGNLAAAYYGMPEVRFHSGGTAPTAFNPRTIAALRAIGFRIDPVGKEGERGDPTTANPIYRVTWGEGLEAPEFSKHYAEKSNPQSEFAALMVCSEADAGCPFVKGATLRLAMPYQDPKIYDGSAYESLKYAERRDDIGRFMLAVMAQARREIASKQSAAD